MAILDDIRRFWDDDAATYDNAPGHRPTSPAVQAAWTAALEALLPPPPARVLDCGAGTGFLSLIAARLGHRVTALDLSPQMLAKLTRRRRWPRASTSPSWWRRPTSRRPTRRRRGSTPSSNATCCGPCPTRGGAARLAGGGTGREAGGHRVAVGRRRPRSRRCGGAPGTR